MFKTIGGLPLSKMEVEDGCVCGEGVNESQGEGIRGEEGGKPVVYM